MEKLKYFVKKGLARFINVILPLISKLNFKADVEKAKREIYSLGKKNSLYHEESLKKIRRLEDKIDLSIIIPVYNAEKTLEMCLGSIVKQKTQYQFEIILVNDGSTDNSKEILNNYKNNYPNVFVIEQENGGAGKARNTGINYAERKIYRFYR